MSKKAKDTASAAHQAAINNMKAAPNKQDQLFEEEEAEALTPQEEEELQRLIRSAEDEQDERDMWDLMAKKWGWEKEKAEKEEKKAADSDWKYGYSAHGGWQGSAEKSAAVFIKCRHKATVVAVIDDIRYCGASREKIENLQFPENYLVIRLLGRVDPVLGGDEALVEILKPTVDQPIHRFLTIDWHDYWEPPLAFEFFDLLHAAAKQQGITHVIAFCEGGHGRTGTFLASALVRLQNLSPAKAVAAVRKSYCKEAVESVAQWEYMDALYSDHNPDYEFPNRHPQIVSTTTNPQPETTTEEKKGKP